jgi:hypothetical protein
MCTITIEQLPSQFLTKMQKLYDRVNVFSYVYQAKNTRQYRQACEKLYKIYRNDSKRGIKYNMGQFVSEEVARMFMLVCLTDFSVYRDFKTGENWFKFMYGSSENKDAKFDEWLANNEEKIKDMLTTGNYQTWMDSFHYNLKSLAPDVGVGNDSPSIILLDEEEDDDEKDDGAAELEKRARDTHERVAKRMKWGAILSKDGLQLQHADEDIRKDSGLVDIATKQNPGAIQYALGKKFEEWARCQDGDEEDGDDEDDDDDIRHGSGSDDEDDDDDIAHGSGGDDEDNDDDIRRDPALVVIATNQNPDAVRFALDAPVHTHSMPPATHRPSPHAPALTREEIHEYVVSDAVLEIKFDIEWCALVVVERHGPVVIVDFFDGTSIRVDDIFAEEWRVLGTDKSDLAAFARKCILKSDNKRTLCVFQDEDDFMITLQKECSDPDETVEEDGGDVVADDAIPDPVIQRIDNLKKQKEAVLEEENALQQELFDQEHELLTKEEDEIRAMREVLAAREEKYKKQADELRGQVDAHVAAMGRKRARIGDEYEITKKFCTQP